MVEQRLPRVDQDDGVWGDILIQYLEKEHFNDDTNNSANGGHKTITIQAGTASPNTAPLKFTSGTLLSTPEAGAVEYQSDTLYFTDTATRRQVVTDTGTHTLTNKTLTAPKFVDNGFIADANGNELVVLGTTASAVNELKITNAATGFSPTIAAQGGDSVVDINLVTKGGGVVKINGLFAASKYTATIGDGSSTSIAVTHNMNTRDVTWSIYDASTYEFVDCDVTSTSTTQITFTFASAPASNSLRVVIIG